jgi:hypothetical protein
VDSAAFAFIGDFRTFLQPCGCTPEQPGGLPRIGTILAAAAEKADASPPEARLQLLDQALSAKAYAQPPSRVNMVLPIECGNFSWVGGHFADVRLKSYLQMLDTIGVNAAVLGAGELQLRLEDAKTLAGSPVPLVSANVKLKQPLFDLKPYVELAPGWYVTGVSSWQPMGKTPPKTSWWEMADPVGGIKAVLAELPKNAKVVVVATYQPDSVYAELRKLPIAALIGPGHWQGQRSQDTSGILETPLMPDQPRLDLPLPAELPAPPAKGVFLPLLLLRPDDAHPAALHADATFLSVDQSWPDDPAIEKLLDEQAAALRDRFKEQRAAEAKAYGDSPQFGMSGQFMPEGQQELTPELLQAKLKAPLRYLGSESCAKCHAAAVEVWHASKHAQALGTLVKHNEANNLDCLQCHTVGLYEPSGYSPDEPDPKLGAVGCENCHGPGSHHTAAAELAKLQGGNWPQPSGAAGKLGNYATRRGDGNGCITCHDPYNSPKFEFAKYWAKVRH